MNLGSSSRPEGSKQSGERLHHRLTLDCDICTTIDNVQGARGNDQLSRSSVLSRTMMHSSQLQLEQMLHDFSLQSCATFLFPSFFTCSRITSLSSDKPMRYHWCASTSASLTFRDGVVVLPLSTASKHPALFNQLHESRNPPDNPTTFHQTRRMLHHLNSVTVRDVP